MQLHIFYIWHGYSKTQFSARFSPFLSSSFTACKSLLNKKSDSAKVRLSRHLFALFCSATLCLVSLQLAAPLFSTTCSFSVPTEFLLFLFFQAVPLSYSTVFPEFCFWLKLLTHVYRILYCRVSQPSLPCS